MNTLQAWFLYLTFGLSIFNAVILYRIERLFAQHSYSERRATTSRPPFET